MLSRSNFFFADELDDSKRARIYIFEVFHPSFFLLFRRRTGTSTTTAIMHRARRISPFTTTFLFNDDRFASFFDEIDDDFVFFCDGRASNALESIEFWRFTGSRSMVSSLFDGGVS